MRGCLRARDPRDVLVSNYFQFTKRGAKEAANNAAYSGTIADFIRGDVGGLRSIVGFYNIWAQSRFEPAGFHLLCYEDLHRDPIGEFRRLASFLNLPDRGSDALDESIGFASFDNMRRLEETNALRSVRLRPGSAGDPETYKVRRGVVGGYRDYLTTDDIAYVDGFLDRELDDFFGRYQAPARSVRC